MAKQRMTCSRCGKSFDPGTGGVDRKTRRPLCPACSGASGVKKPSLGGTIAKVAVGALFAAVSFQEPESGSRLSYFLVAMVLALSLIAWGLIPWLRVWREEKRAAAELELARKEAERARAEKAEQRKICPCCGAPTRGKVCEYCGSRLPDD